MRTHKYLIHILSGMQNEISISMREAVTIDRKNTLTRAWDHVLDARLALEDVDTKEAEADRIDNNHKHP